MIMAAWVIVHGKGKLADGWDAVNDKQKFFDLDIAIADRYT